MQWWKFACPRCEAGVLGYTIREPKEGDDREDVWNHNTFLIHGDGAATKEYDIVACASCGAQRVEVGELSMRHVERCDAEQSRQLTERVEKSNSGEALDPFPSSHQLHGFWELSEREREGPVWALGFQSPNRQPARNGSIIMISNMKKIASNVYLVRTQAGFRKAVQDCFSDTFEDLPWMMRSRMDGNPDSYPAVVSLTLGYKGDVFIQCSSVHVEVMKEALSNA